MRSLAVKRPRVGCEMSELAIIHDGGMLIRNGKRVLRAVFLRWLVVDNERSAG